LSLGKDRRVRRTDVAERVALCLPWVRVPLPTLTLSLPLVSPQASVPCRSHKWYKARGGGDGFDFNNLPNPAAVVCLLLSLKYGEVCIIDNRYFPSRCGAMQASQATKSCTQHPPPLTLQTPSFRRHCRPFRCRRVCRGASASRLPRDFRWGRSGEATVGVHGGHAAQCLPFWGRHLPAVPPRRKRVGYLK
jgi:hypothetical protein